MYKILKYTIFDLMRSRWSYLYFGFYLLASMALLYLSHDLAKAIVSLMNIILILSPLIGTLFGIMYFYNSREFVELLLAQPIKRSSLFLGQYLGLAFSLSLSFALGIGLPFLFFGLSVSPEIGNFWTLLFAGVALTFIFSGIALWVAVSFEDKIKGFGLVLVIWLFMAVIYDGVFLLSLLWFEAYPLEKFAVGATLFNPIDLARILILLKLDISAMMGYTGAVFNKFFGTGWGMGWSVASLMLWVLIPAMGFLRVAGRKDF